MSTVGSRELKTRLGTYLRRVALGETIVVTQHGTPVAELRPIGEGMTDLEARLERLRAKGVLRRGTGGDLEPFDPLAVSGARLTEAVIEGRDDRF